MRAATPTAHQREGQWSDGGTLNRGTKKTTSLTSVSDVGGWPLLLRLHVPVRDHCWSAKTREEEKIKILKTAHASLAMRAQGGVREAALWNLLRSLS